MNVTATTRKTHWIRANNSVAETFSGAVVTRVKVRAKIAAVIRHTRSRDATCSRVVASVHAISPRDSRGYDPALSVFTFARVF